MAVVGFLTTEAVAAALAEHDPDRRHHCPRHAGYDIDSLDNSAADWGTIVLRTVWKPPDQPGARRRQSN